MTKVSALIFAVLVLNVGLADAATTYTVKKGDTLYRISREFDIPVAKIKHANRIRSNALAEGRRLIIPDCNVEPKHAAEEPHRPTDKLTTGQRLAVKAGETGSYTVKKGDSLAKIAAKAHMNAAEIREINGLRSDVLKPGQTLRLARTSQYADPERDRLTEISPVEQPATPAEVPAKAAVPSDVPESQDISQMGLRDRLLLFAKKMLDLPYRFGGNGIFGIDCSAFVQRTFGAVGITLPRSAREQFEVGTEIEKDNLSAGDLVFFRTYASFPSHVGIYLGNNFFIHASSKSKKVTIDSLETPYYVNRFIGARRLVGDETNLAGFVE
jgi:cell wall-associated NlpC family hydrolase